jgi:hypothetical protein
MKLLILKIILYRVSQFCSLSNHRKIKLISLPTSCIIIIILRDREELPHKPNQVIGDFAPQAEDYFNHIRII